MLKLSHDAVGVEREAIQAPLNNYTIPGSPVWPKDKPDRLAEYRVDTFIFGRNRTSLE